jgi:hypothetical protein
MMPYSNWDEVFEKKAFFKRKLFFAVGAMEKGELHLFFGGTNNAYCLFVCFLLLVGTF